MAEITARPPFVVPPGVKPVPMMMAPASPWPFSARYLRSMNEPMECPSMK